MSHLKTLSTLFDIDGYTEAGAKRKQAMHLRGRDFLKQLANDLGLKRGEFDIRSNPAGIAISGEVTMHADHLYVQLSEHFGKPGVSVLYRSCMHRKDYVGGRNHQATIRQVAAAYDSFVSQCRELIATGVRSAEGAHA